jgi:hypothetical protein
LQPRRHGGGEGVSRGVGADLDRGATREPDSGLAGA